MLISHNASLLASARVVGRVLPYELFPLFVMHALSSHIIDSLFATPIQCSFVMVVIYIRVKNNEYKNKCIIGISSQRFANFIYN